MSLVDPISDDDLARVQSPLMSPLVWDLGHIAAFEDLWLSHRFGERPLLRADLVAARAPRRPGTMPVTVTAGRYTPVTMLLDSGIR